MEALEKALVAAEQAVFNDHFDARDACAALFRLLRALAEPDQAAPVATETVEE